MQEGMILYLPIWFDHGIIEYANAERTAVGRWELVVFVEFWQIPCSDGSFGACGEEQSFYFVTFIPLLFAF